ncbi:MAG: flagellar hook-basal body complex protein FliE [Candidatus Eremiobacteraeota bacterium]|nr:flagellar hook-basal body complex protein FliE [Candidatus Eremiobacteraeota bacterium]
MTVTPLPSIAGSVPEPDLGMAAPAPAAASFEGALAGVLEGTSSALGRADVAERAFAAGRGGLQEMMLERAQADVALSVAGAAASRAAQALTTILGMQV